MRITPAKELELRIGKLQGLMAENGLDAVIVVQNADLFYFAGSVQKGNLYIPLAGDAIYLASRDFMRARMESGLKEVIPAGALKDLPAQVSDYGYCQPKRIGLELDVMPVAIFNRYRSLYPEAEFVDASPLIRRVRMIKSAYEIHILQDAADQADKVYRRAREVIREGMTDLDLAAELEHAARKLGHQGLVRMRSFNGEIFYGHIFSGTDTAIPSYLDAPLGGVGLSPAFGQGAGYKPIERDEPVIVDFVSCVDGYMVDQTRIFVLGTLSERLRRAYDDMLLVQQRMTELAVVGASWSAVYESCRGLAVELGYADSFMGAGGAQVSFIGHGIGIEVDEYPFIARGFSDMRLEPGMVFAFEPKVVFPGEGAVGIENTYYLSYEGLKRLTHSDDELVVL